MMLPLFALIRHEWTCRPGGGAWHGSGALAGLAAVRASNVSLRPLARAEESEGQR